MPSPAPHTGAPPTPVDSSATRWMFPGTPDDFMQCLGRLPLAHQPGDRWLSHERRDLGVF